MLYLSNFKSHRQVLKVPTIMARSGLTLLLIFAGTPTTQAAEPAPTIATVCAACHGPNGVSNNPLWPNLAGQKKDYLLKALKDFRDGRRQDPLMTPVSKTLMDSDLEVLAQYFSTQQSAK